jgi:hypothetical protein
MYILRVGRDSSVGIATRYGLDGPGIECRWGRDFPHPSRPAPVAHPASCKMCTGSFPGVKRPGRGVDHPPPSSAGVKERVELYLYSPSGPSWPVLGRTLPLPLPYPQTQPPPPRPLPRQRKALGAPMSSGTSFTGAGSHRFFYLTGI